MKSFREFLLGIGEFKSADEIIKLVSQFCKSQSLQDQMSNAQALLIFQTSTQQTWLIRGNNRLYCVLDDLKRAFTRVQWHTPLNELILKDGNILRLATRDKTEKTGLLDIGSHSNWLFSKKLFTENDIKMHIENLINPLTMR